MPELTCAECGEKYEVEFGEDTHCPECGFGPDRCSHPIEERDSRMVYDHGEKQEIEFLYCGKCGQPVNN
jgi:hypothetical protein